MAQNQITTPTGQPLLIGNQGIRHATLTSASATQTTNNGKVLALDGTGNFILAPDNGGQWTNNAANISFTTGNVGIGTNAPLQRLHVNGDINVPTGNGLRINNVTHFRQIGTLNSLAIGINAGTNASTTNAIDNILIGSGAGFVSNGPFNIFIGTRSGLANTLGGYNTFIGRDAGRTNTTGTRNFFLGTSSGYTNNGDDNMFLGYFTGYKNSTGSDNFMAATNAGYNNSGGSFNLFVGRDAGFNNTSGSRNTALGYGAGTGVVSGENNTFIGYSARATGASAATISNSTAIGSGAQVTASNSIILGAAGSSVGIGNTAPLARLHVVAGGTTATGVRFQGLPNAAGSIFKLYVDANGNVMKSSTAGAREGSDLPDGFWSVTPDEHLINTNAGGIILGSGIASTPKGYKLYVAEGILTEKVKVAIQNTDDWSDKVFADTYRLRSLSEVEAFINKNKHLPDIPSATEVVEKGVDVGKMDALLLQKIEELTLYMIELKKSNEQLRKELNELKK
jgi:hypothetical protein